MTASSSSASSASRHAAALVLPLAPDLLLSFFAALLAVACALAVLAALALQSAAADLPWLPPISWRLLALPLAAVAGLLGWRCMRHAPLRLRWDGQAWWLAQDARAPDAEQPVHIAVAIDFGAWLLLRLSRPGRPWMLPRYLALWRGLVAADWPALRATLYLAPQSLAADPYG